MDWDNSSSPYSSVDSYFTEKKPDNASLQCVMPKSKTKKCTRKILSITIKRKNIHLSAEDKYGHWWFELGDSTSPNLESYGWWPKDHVGLGATLGGTEGELNGQTNFGGTSTRDPHHGDIADEIFNPVVDCSDQRTDEEIKNCLRSFAQSYSGEWRWTFGAGQNCHTFQEAAMKHCNIRRK